MKKVKVLCLSAALLLVVGANVFAQKEKLTLEGSTTLLPIAQSAAEKYMDLNPSANLVVRGGGSGVGITSLIDGICDIANSSREIKPAEITAAQAKKKQIEVIAVAKDGITVIVSNNNPVSNLTQSQIADIYTGKVTNWSQVGGKNEKIVVVSRDSASGTFEAFAELALKGQKVIAGALMQSSNQAIVSLVSKTSGAIGYVGVGYASQSIKAVKVNGIAADKTTVQNGTYPFSRDLYMCVIGKPKGETKKFIDFVLSPQGQAIVEEQGFVSIK
ncbi:MAG: PstS family phosphate ABC transporter substrate-binding protein [Elusimicrobiota bacterium]|jgi:phosphate transport system substrate-binding protein|nr:PstS family phosphate ABC transporter substrate-binding protein [Elusimicrobiota bacterium]